MPPEEKIDDIKRDIEDLGHKVTNIWNIKKRGTKKPLNMFYIELKSENKNKNIYQTTHMFGYRVKFEPPHVKRETLHCINCQRYGHTKGFCNRKARCVKCAGDIRLLAVNEKLNPRTSSTCCVKEITQPIINVARSTKIYNKDISPHYGKRK